MLYSLCPHTNQRRYEMPAVVNKDECVGCGACVEVCPQEAITMDDVAVIDVNECIDCGACVDECPNGAITIKE